MERLAEAVAATGARVEADIRVQRLVLDGSTAWSASSPARPGATSRVRARRGVVLCAGGFVHSDEMVARHSPLVASLLAAARQRLRRRHRHPHGPVASAPP